MVDRYMARILADSQDRLVELGVDPDDAESFVDDVEQSIEKLLASSDVDTDTQDEDK
ncbi:MAG TPA: hypothetical protein VGB78_04240 [Thermoplasmata archaeon]